MNFGDQSIIEIEGIVKKKREYSGRGSEYELHIKSKDESEVYILDTKGTETKKYEINSAFKKKLLKGAIGIIYLKDSIEIN